MDLCIFCIFRIHLLTPLLLKPNVNSARTHFYSLVPISFHCFLLYTCIVFLFFISFFFPFSLSSLAIPPLSFQTLFISLLLYTSAFWFISDEQRNLWKLLSQKHYNIFFLKKFHLTGDTLQSNPAKNNSNKNQTPKPKPNQHHEHTDWKKAKKMIQKNPMLWLKQIQQNEFLTFPHSIQFLLYFSHKHNNYLYNPDHFLTSKLSFLSSCPPLWMTIFFPTLNI